MSSWIPARVPATRGCNKGCLPRSPNMIITNIRRKRVHILCQAGVVLRCFFSWRLCASKVCDVTDDSMMEEVAVDCRLQRDREHYKDQCLEAIMKEHNKQTPFNNNRLKKHPPHNTHHHCIFKFQQLDCTEISKCIHSKPSSLPSHSSLRQRRRTGVFPVILPSLPVRYANVVQVRRLL